MAIRVSALVLLLTATAVAQAPPGALKRTLDGIDLPELEKVWRKWVVDMRDPWPSLRKKKRARYKK